MRKRWLSYRNMKDDSYRNELSRMLRAEETERQIERKQSGINLVIQQNTYSVIKYTFITNIFINGALAIATVRMMTYAEGANRISRSNSHIQLRAYVSDLNIENVELALNKRSDTDDSNSIGVSIKNFGQTPAYNLIVLSAASIAPVGGAKAD